jgi:transcription elongation GreA/GreB family factor
MSRAFVKEQDDAPEELLERPVSANPNFVTARGLHFIEEELERLRKVQAQAQAEDDKAAVARAGRDLRYWMQRRASAQLVAPPAEIKSVAFATSATILREDGRRQRFSIVGEDEADPAKGLIAYVSPMARALLGKAVGDFAEAPGGEVEIVDLKPVDAEW